MSTREQSNTTQGIIYAKPEDISTSGPLAKVLGVSTFLKVPENRDKIQLPGDETQFGWVNMSGYHPTAQVRRNGRIKVLMQI